MTNDASSHSPIVGFLADGIPIYGPRGANGAIPSDLDECNGHDSDQPFYHYHATTNAPYLVQCLKGCVFRRLGWSNIGTNICKKASSKCHCMGWCPFSASMCHRSSATRVCVSALRTLSHLCLLPGLLLRESLTIHA